MPNEFEILSKVYDNIAINDAVKKCSRCGGSSHPSGAKKTTVIFKRSKVFCCGKKNGKTQKKGSHKSTSS